MPTLPKPWFHTPSHQIIISKHLSNISNDMLFPFSPPLPTPYHNTQGLTPTHNSSMKKKTSNPHTPQTFSPSPHTTGMMCLHAHAASVHATHATHATSTWQMPARGRGGSQLLQGNFGGVFLGVVHVLSIVPVAGLDDVLTGDGDGGGPCSAAAAPVGNDVEYRRLHLWATAMFYKREKWAVRWDERGEGERGEERYLVAYPATTMRIGDRTLSWER